MATDMDRAYCEWSRNELSDRNDSQAESVSQLLDQGSVSFGRFAVESLSWEKWSVFSHNRCQEELEKFNGLVAQKRAYFEEHYRRIRALKAMQVDQKDACALDSANKISIPHDSHTYGTDCSLAGEEQSNEFTVSSPRRHLPQSIDTCDGLESHITCSGENDAEVSVTIEQETDSIDVPQIQYVELESVTSYSDSVIRRLHNERTEKHFEKHKHDECHDNEGIKSVHESSLTLIEPQNAEPETAMLPPVASNRGSEVTKGRKAVPKGVGLNSKKFENRASPTKLKDASAQTRNSGRLKYQSIRKEAAASNINTGKLDHKAELPAHKSSKGPKDPLCKVTGNPESRVKSRNAALAGVSSISKSTSTPLHRSPTPTHSNVTVPRPFSLATERRAIPPDGVSGNASSKASNKLIRLSVQNPSKEMISITSKLKNTTSGARRVREEIVSKTVVSDSRRAIPKGRDAEEHGVRDMSCSIPSRSKSSQNGVAFGLRSNVRADKHKEVHIKMEGSSDVKHANKNRDLGKRKEKDKLEMKESRTSLKFSSSPLPGFYKNHTSKPESKKILPAQSMNALPERRKPR